MPQKLYHCIKKLTTLSSYVVSLQNIRFVEHLVLDDLYCSVDNSMLLPFDISVFVY